jgi:hypothetical protein
MYVNQILNQRDDMLTKTRNYTTTEYALMHNTYIITYEIVNYCPINNK